MSAGRGRDGKRPFGRRVSETAFFVNGHSFFLAIGENGFDFSYAMQQNAMSVASMGKKDRTFLDFVAHF